MKAIEFREDQTAHVVELPVPTPGPGDVVVRVAATGICGSDLTALSGRHPFRIPPLISGHEAGGTIVALGAEVQGWTVGDRVAIEPQVSCGACAVCARGDLHLCPAKVMLGVAEWPGSFAEQVRVPATTLHPVPPEVDGELSALVEPMAVAVHAVRQAPPVDGQDVVVLGAGTIGAMIAHQALRAGAASVAITDPRAANRERSTALGATGYDPTDGGWRETALARTRDSAFDVALVATAVPGILDEAIGLVRPRGTIVQVGLFSGAEAITVSALQIPEKRLVGSNVYDGTDIREAIDSIAAAPDAIRALITHRGDLAAAAHHLTRRAAGEPDDVVKYVIIPDRTTHED